MGTKERAEYLFNKYIEIVGSYDLAQQCALFAVDEIVNSKHEFKHEHEKDSFILFWSIVKLHINRF